MFIIKSALEKEVCELVKDYIVYKVVTEQENHDVESGICYYTTKRENTEYFQIRLNNLKHTNNDLLIEVDQALSRDALLIQLKRDNVIGRMEAANNLSEHLQDSQVLQQLKRTAYYDKSWFVRQASLSVVSSELMFKEWTVAYDREKNSQPRKTIITEMATNYPTAAADFIRNKIPNDNSYIVQAEMVKQLGIVGNQSDVKLINKYAQEWSPRHIIDRAAKRAISSLQGE